MHILSLPLALLLQLFLLWLLRLLDPLIGINLYSVSSSSFVGAPTGCELALSEFFFFFFFFFFFSSHTYLLYNWLFICILLLFNTLTSSSRCESEFYYCSFILFDLLNTLTSSSRCESEFHYCSFILFDLFNTLTSSSRCESEFYYYSFILFDLFNTLTSSSRCESEFLLLFFSIV
jgi:hypothetical protein